MNKENVYLVRGKNGEYALGTKICRSSNGAKNSMNNFVDGMIDYKVRTNYSGFNNPMNGLGYLWRWGAAKPALKEWKTLEQYLLTCQLNIAKITEQDYDEFIELVTEIEDYWHVEEVTQDGNDTN